MLEDVMEYFYYFDYWDVSLFVCVYVYVCTDLFLFEKMNYPHSPQLCECWKRCILANVILSISTLFLGL